MEIFARSTTLLGAQGRGTIRFLVEEIEIIFFLIFDSFSFARVLLRID